MKSIITTLSVLAVVVGFTIWSNDHTEKALAAYTAYEECVQAQYGMSPSTYYHNHGTTPECK